MALEKLTLGKVENMDNGKIGAMFRQHLQKCVEDINDRPGDQTGRTVSFKMTLTPTGASGIVDDVKVGFSITSSVPANKTRDYSMLPDGKGQLIFNDVSRENVRQKTLDDAKQD